MLRRTPLLVAFAALAACNRRSDVAPLDHDTAAVAATSSARQRDSARVDVLLHEAADSLAAADTVAAEGALAAAVTVADTDAALVAHIADRSLALGLAAYAELGYRRYLTLAPAGPVAEQARTRLGLLTSSTLPPPSPIRGVRAPAPHVVAARVERAHVVVRPRVVARTVSRAQRPAPRVAVRPPAPASASTAASVSAGDVVQRDAPESPESPVTVATSAAPAAPSSAPRARRAPVARDAAMGAASGAVLGAVVGHGARGALVGMVAGGALGALLGARR